MRLYALQKTMRSMDLGAELGAHIYVFWGGREGAEVDAAKDPRDALKWNREALDFLCEYSIEQGYDYKFALEAKPNEPRGDIYLATTGAMLGFIATLDHAEMVGVNPEVGHEQMSGLNFYHVVAQAIEAGKLFHIDLTIRKARASIRTCALVPSQSRICFSWSSCWKKRTRARATSTRMLIAARTKTASGNSRPAVCATI